MMRIFALLVAFLLFAGTADARSLRNLAYGPHEAQKIDVHIPDSPKNAPLIVMMHGGAWAFGDKSHRKTWKPKAEYWGAKGFIVVSVNTRLLPDANPIEQARDLARAMAFIQREAKGWKGDAGRLILMGHSAGGHLVTLLASRQDLRRGLRPWRGTVSLDAGGLDVVGVMNRNPPRLYRRAFGSDPAFWAAASPSAHVDRAEGPFLLVCSTRRVAPCRDGKVFAQNGGSVSILPVNKSHGAINGDLGTPSGYTQAVDRWIERALAN